MAVCLLDSLGGLGGVVDHVDRPLRKSMQEHLVLCRLRDGCHGISEVKKSALWPVAQVIQEPNDADK